MTTKSNKKICEPLVLSHDYLHEIMRYDSATGNLYWKSKRKNQKATKDPIGYTDPKGYRYIKVDGRRYAAHRIIWCMNHREWPNGLIDHRNQNPSDNRADNLRVASRSINAKNTKLREDNTSGVMGVCWHKNKKRWVVRINSNRKRVELGSYKTFKEAVAVRRGAEVKCGYHNNHGGCGNGY